MLRSKIKFTADLHALISRKLLDDIGHVELVMSKFQRIDLKRNEQLLNEGDVCKHVYFITQGCLQAYVYGTKMLESTKKIGTFCRLFFFVHLQKFKLTNNSSCQGVFFCSLDRLEYRYGDHSART